MKTLSIRTLIFGGALACAGLIAAQTQMATAAPPSSTTSPKVLRATGVLVLVDDGEIVLTLELPAAEVAKMSKLPGVEDGLPTTPGHLGFAKGAMHVRYQLAADAELEKRATALIGQKVVVELGKDRLVAGMKRVP